MKKVYTLFLTVLITATIWAQSPQKMSFQAVIRNASNALVITHAVGMRISILQGTATGTPVYVETQTTTTNANGLVTIEIGGGTVVTGTFAGIDWSSGTFFIKTETDPTGGSSYTVTGTSQLLSVPYALHSKTAENAADKTYVDALLQRFQDLEDIVYTQLPLPTNGLVAYYPFNGNANDLSGYHNDGIVYGATPISDRHGISNSALIFDGENDYIEINHSSSLNIIQQISISFWAKFETSGPYYYPYHIIEKHGCWGLGQRENDIYWSVTTSKGEFGVWTLNFNFNQWYHFVMLYDGSKIMTFVNGQLYVSNPASGSIITNTNKVYISRYNFGGDYFFDGTLDDIRIYNRKLSDAEIISVV